MRITFVAHVFPPEPDPTAVMAGELVRGFEEAGHDVLVISPFPNRPAGEVYEGWARRPLGRFVHSRSPVLRVWTWMLGKARRPWNRILENATFGLGSAIAFALSRRPDVLLLESWPVLAYLPVMLVAKARGVPVIDYVQDVYPEAATAAGLFPAGSRIDRALRALHAWICREAAVNVAISEGMKRMLAETRGVPEDRFRVICNWLDLSRIAPHEGPSTWRAEHGIGDDELVAMFSGTLGLASGADVLVDVAARLRDVPGLRIVCVGEGLHKEGMRRRASELGLANLTFLPFQPRERVSEAQSSADAMLLTTSAGMGLSSVPSKLVTYLAVGRPVICGVAADSDIAALVEGEGLGLVVPPADAEALADALLRLRAMPREQRAGMGRRARRIALERYSLESALQSFERLFAELEPAAGGARGPELTGD